MINPEFYVPLLWGGSVVTLAVIYYATRLTPEEQAKKDAEQEALRQHHQAVRDQEAFQRRADFYSPIVEAASKCSYVTFNGTTMSVNIKDLATTKLAKKEVMLLKRLVNAQKRAIYDEYNDLRDDYSLDVGTRGIMMPGGGKIGSVIRVGQRISRASARSRMAQIKQNKENAIDPWDSLLEVCNEWILTLDRLIIDHEIAEIS